MKFIKALIHGIRYERWGKRLSKEYGERCRYFALFFYSNDEVGITVAYDNVYFSVMHLERIKTYNEFSVRARLAFVKSYEKT